MIRNIHELYQYRALLYSLTVRELTARYRASVLGFLWTFLNPTLQMVVYSLVFQSTFKSNLRAYSYFLFVGLLPWGYFAASLTAGAGAISDRRDLMTKVRFPAQVLPATVVLSNLTNYVLSLPLMIGLGLFFGFVPTWHLVLFVPVLVVQTLFTLALTYIVSALNVAFRDLQYIVSNVITLWFFATPVIWPIWQNEGWMRRIIPLVNPMAPIITAYQDILYHQTLPPFRPLLALTGVSLALLWIASEIFESRREEFAELV